METGLKMIITLSCCDRRTVPEYCLKGNCVKLEWTNDLCFYISHILILWIQLYGVVTIALCYLIVSNLHVMMYFLSGLVWSSYLRDAGGGRIHKVPEQWPSVIRADGGGSVGEEVVVKYALSKKLVKESARVGRAQGASEPGVLDGNIHSDWRLFGLARLGLAQVGRWPAQLRVQQVKEGWWGKRERTEC